MLSSRKRRRSRANRSKHVERTGCPLLEVGLKPAEAFHGRRARLVLATDPSAVADAVDVLEEKRIIDFARAGLVTSRIVGELHVRDATKIRFDRAREIAFHDLHVIDV